MYETLPDIDPDSPSGKESEVAPILPDENSDIPSDIDPGVLPQRKSDIPPGINPDIGSDGIKPHILSDTNSGLLCRKNSDILTDIHPAILSDINSVLLSDMHSHSLFDIHSGILPDIESSLSDMDSDTLYLT